MQKEIPNVAQMLIAYLKLEGVSHVFGVPGGGLIEMLDEFYTQRDDIKYVICRQETGAAYMADGYYRASGKLGVVMVTTGPGATNALTGVMNAEAGGSAMLALTGEIAEAYAGMGYLQEGIDGKLDVNAIYQASSAYSTILTSGVNAQRLAEAALRTALDVPRHAAHISLPVDVTGQQAVKLGKPGDPPVPVTMPDSPARYRSPPPVAAPHKVEQTLEILAAAQRPLIMLGNGCREALRDSATLAAFTHFVEARGIPVITTADGKGVFPEDHPLSLRMFGIANCIWPYYWMTQEDPHYDALLVIGSGLGELATNKWNPILRPKGPIVQLDANQRVIARDFPVDLGVVGEAGAFINALARLSGEAPPPPDQVAARKAKVAQIKANHSPFSSDAQYKATTTPVQPAALCRVMQDVLPADKTIIMLDAGNCVGWGAHYLVSKPGFEVHASLDMGPMGFASGAVVGAKLARPDATCVAFTGDGAFMMQGTEISTAQRNGVGAIWVVLHDDDLSMVSQGMEHFKGGNIDDWKEMFSLGSPDLAQFASGLGADAYTVNSPDTFETALKTAVAKAEADKKPQVIVAQIDRTAEPPYYDEKYAPSKAQARLLTMRKH
ncbi:thiamine pyrophosphate-binding protein [Yoonia sediminilitoris]|uniref:Acetolactate synthase-1/2/3 large subunit n=1 Tax=Yoonia sediminilitoris TaxID=1286148 RepID=A0A2T6KMY6_9RHOB|nr:thiamine pyrophosphate-binding protein [Yoonia sediminilitoris]PUB17517.1 acetolactate synthase-1/2/3 large subunit [Yoonia sediminilitoris]RCW97812.1 acetolactate synthase-1/2/3 large subunit [Yoonia sediminilitoris]